MSPRSISLVYLHMAVFLLAFPPLFAKAIPLPAPVLIWGRSLVATIVLVLFIRYRQGKIPKISKPDILSFLLLGVLLAAHWVLLFYSAQISTVAIALISLFTFPVFTALLEPYFFSVRIKISDIGVALFVLVGIILITPEFSLENTMSQGIALGIISAITFALRNILSKKYLQKYSGSVIMAAQTAIVTILLVPVFFLFSFEIRSTDIGGILLLGVVFTALAHTLLVQSLKNLSAFSMGIGEALTVVYGILFAAIFLSETPDLRTFLGGSIIVLAAIFEQISHFRKK